MPLLKLLGLCSGRFLAPLLAYCVRKTTGGANVGVTVIARSFLKPISVRYGLEKVPNQNLPVLVIGSIQFFNDDTEVCGFNDYLSHRCQTSRILGDVLGVLIAVPG